MKHWSSENFLFNKRNTFILILTFTILLVLDSTVIKFFSHSEMEFFQPFRSGLFIIFFIIFILLSMLMLISIYENRKKIGHVRIPIMKYFDPLIFGIQVLLIIIILANILQMNIINKYNIFFLHAITLLTHIPCLIFMGKLVYLFSLWLRSKWNFTMLMYTISFGLLSFSIVVSLIYLETFFSLSRAIFIRPFPIPSYITSHYSLNWTQAFGYYI